MALVQHMVTVDAPASLVWALLKEKIERPERFVPGARDVEIVRRIDDRAVERVMRIGPPDAPRTVREVISYDDATMTVIFKLVDDPVNVGFVTNTIFEDAGLVKLDFTMRWTRRDGGRRRRLHGPRGDDPSRRREHPRRVRGGAPRGEGLSVEAAPLDAVRLDPRPCSTLLP